MQCAEPSRPAWRSKLLEMCAVVSALTRSAYRRAEVREALERHLRHEPTRAGGSRIKRLRGLSQPQYRLAVEIRRAPTEFCDWEILLKLLHAAFAYQNDRIDPPSSLHGFDAESIALKAKDEHLFLAVEDGELMQAAEDFARQTGHTSLELDSRIESTENHETFAASGFVKTAEHAHAGYDHTVFITMRKPLD